jgi:hypothetical protein
VLVNWSHSRCFGDSCKTETQPATVAGGESWLFHVTVWDWMLLLAAGASGHITLPKHGHCSTAQAQASVKRCKKLLSGKCLIELVNELRTLPCYDTTKFIAYAGEAREVTFLGHCLRPAGSRNIFPHKAGFSSNRSTDHRFSLLRSLRSACHLKLWTNCHLASRSRNRFISEAIARSIQFAGVCGCPGSAERNNG